MFVNYWPFQCGVSVVPPCTYDISFDIIFALCTCYADYHQVRLRYMSGHVFEKKCSIS